MPRPRFCGKAVSDDEWELIVEIVAACGVSRHELARTICEALARVRSNGQLKARECYEYLDLLERRGLLELPARREQRPRGRTSIVFTEAGVERARRKGRLSDVAPVALGLVTNAAERALWRELVERYHYLGQRWPMGRTCGISSGSASRSTRSPGVFSSPRRRGGCGRVTGSSAGTRLRARRS